MSPIPNVRPYVKYYVNPTCNDTKCENVKTYVKYYVNPTNNVSKCYNKMGS